jgi:hypothetical protein
MIEELKDAVILNKVGGRFKLSSLIQKRMVEMMEGGRHRRDDDDGNRRRGNQAEQNHAGFHPRQNERKVFTVKYG